MVSQWHLTDGFKHPEGNMRKGSGGRKDQVPKGDLKMLEKLLLRGVSYRIALKESGVSHHSGKKIRDMIIGKT